MSNAHHSTQDSLCLPTLELLSSPTITIDRKKSLDVISNYIHKADKSKTRRLLNLVYSLVFGFFSTHYMSPSFRHRNIMGAVLALSAYLASTKIFHRKEADEQDV